MGIFSIFSTKTPEKITGTIDSLLENIDKALSVFKEGIKNYLYNDQDIQRIFYNTRNIKGTLK